jgi:hypothetical protein
MIEINPEPTSLTATVTDIHLRGSASEVIGGLIERLRSPSGSSCGIKLFNPGKN